MRWVKTDPELGDVSDEHDEPARRRLSIAGIGACHVPAFTLLPATLCPESTLELR